MRTRSPRGAWVRLVLMASAIGIFVIGYYWGNQYRYSGGPPAIEGVLVAPAMALPAFELMDADGQPFASDDLADRWSLLAFGEISQARGQLAITRMIDVYNRLANHPEARAHLQMALAAPVQPLDTARDFSRLSPALHVLSGDGAELTRLAAALGDVPDGHSDAQAALYLIAPNGDLLALFAASQPAESISEDLVTLSKWPLEALAVAPDE